MSADVIEDPKTDNTVTDEVVDSKSEVVDNKDEVVLGDKAIEKEENILGEAVKVEDLKDAEDKPFAPESYEDFTLPKDSDVSEDNVKLFNEQAKELDLTQEQAQKLLNKQLALQDEQLKAYEQEQVQKQEKWVDELKTDTEFGGKNMGETIERANRTLRTFADEDVIGLLKDTGYANNPSVIKMFARIDKQIGEDSVVNGKGAVKEQSPIDKLYDNPTSGP